MYKVLLISYANWDSLLELPAVLKKAGCTVDIYSKKNAWALQNSSYSKWIAANEHDDLYIRELLDFVDKNGDEYNWIIPGDDPLIRLLNEHLQSEKLFYKIMPLTKIENRELLGSKAGFSNLCKQYNIKTPRFLIYNPLLSVEEIGAYMGYPFLAKLDQSEAGTGIFSIENEEMLKETLYKVANKENLVFQQFIKGYDINIEALYKNGELLVYNYSHVLTILGNYGLSTRRLFCRNTEVDAEMMKIGRSIGLNGFASIAFMYSETERTHYLIEIDARPNSWIYYGKFTGNDFSEAIKNMINGNLAFMQPGDKAKEVKIYHYLKDMARCIVNKDVKGATDWLVNKDGCRQYIPHYDRKTLAACNKYLRFFFTELFTNKIRKAIGKPVINTTYKN